MATLNNPTDADLYSHVLGEIVPANGSVEISDEQAEQVNTASGIWTITERRVVTRGGKRAEISGKPAMETR